MHHVRAALPYIGLHFIDLQQKTSTTRVRKPHQPPPPPRSLNIPSAGPTLEPGLVTSCFLSFIVFFFLSLFSSHLFIQNPLSHPYTAGQGLTYQLPCQVCDLLLKLGEFVQSLTFVVPFICDYL